MKNNVVVINPADNVGVAVEELKAGSEARGIDFTLRAETDIPKNHKIALAFIKAGDPVIKYGEPIGRALVDIKPGEWVHTHNLKWEES